MSETDAVNDKAPVPQWIQKLPAVIRVVIVFVYCDLLRPGDTFLQELRKIVITIGLLISCCTIGLTTLNWLTVDSDDWRAGAVVARVFPIGYTITWLSLFIFVRVTGNSSERVTDMWLLCTWVFVFMSTMSSPDLPADLANLLLLIVAILGRTSWLPLHYVLNLVALAIGHYNTASFARGEPDSPIVAFPGYLMRELWIRQVLTFLNYGAAIFVIGGLQLQMMESDRQTRQAAVSGEMALDIAEAVARYDTARANAILEDQLATEDSESRADPKLVEALKVLVTNLDKYRPHLPNWLLAETMGSTASDDEDLASLSDDDKSLHADSRRKSVGFAESSGDVEGRATSSNGGRMLHRKGSDRVTDADEGSNSSGGARRITRNPAKQLELNVARTVTATVAYVHFAMGSAADRSAVMCAFVDRAYELASTTGGAVHSFVGNLLVLSWNAASRAVQHEVKAARFMTQLRDETGHGAVNVGGAIGTGRVSVQLAGSGASSALTLEASWLPVVERAASFGAEVRGVVATAAAQRELAQNFMVHPLTAVMVPSAAVLLSADVPTEESNGSRPHVVYEVASEATVADDEWMYVLKQRELAADTPHAVAATEGGESKPASIAAIATEVGQLANQLARRSAYDTANGVAAAKSGVRERCACLKQALTDLGPGSDAARYCTAWFALKHLLQSAASADE